MPPRAVTAPQFVLPTAADPPYLFLHFRVINLLISCGSLSRLSSLFELLLLHALTHDNGQVAAYSIHNRDQSLRRSIDQEEELGVDLLLGRHCGQRLDLFGRDHAAFYYACLERELRIVLGILRQRLGQRYRISLRVGNRGPAFQVLQNFFDFASLGGALSQRVLDHAIASTRGS